MCDDSKWATNKDGGVKSPAAKTKGKPSGIKDMKICNQLDRTKWCQKIPKGHDEDACHMMSQKRRCVLQMMKKLVDEHVNSPVCPEWDTSTTCENTPGPYRFGVYKSGNDDNYKIIASQMTASGCECIKRNGLQDDCRLPRCRGSPSCRITPFPRCEPFLGVPVQKTGVPAVTAAVGYGDECRCPQTASQ
ncbi:uncharacterized protein LOC129000020 [Macrosteles quadrilineatus]|uniref:uncharacterized protein LOC129000020 n=1 Tax=Macrosteles quadrilineatus TaxID=74068 RepID=UPI0023E2DD8D|nr:uncharacterized protein LOC129000020 [Macrosteles quadrilineatus]